jgi:phosphoglycerate dehydrogenase-like enzyme
MSDNHRPVAMYCGREGLLPAVYGPSERASIEAMVSIGPLEAAEVILGTWGMPVLDAAFFERAPRVRIVFYGAGSIHGFVTDEIWRRGIRVVSGWEANAVPVAQYTLASILFSLKWGWRFAAAMRGLTAMPEKEGIPGGMESTVGLVSLGAVGRLVAGHLRAHDLRVLAYDPLVDPEVARGLRVQLVALEDLFAESDVVSVHTPLLAATRGMIRGAHVASMRAGATLVNTSRGAILREPEIVEVLRRRPDLQAVLDVTDPEPPGVDSPLRTLPNVVLTPHIAGALGRERRRLGRLVCEELARYVTGRPLHWEITQDRLPTLA